MSKKFYLSPEADIILSHLYASPLCASYDPNNGTEMFQEEEEQII